MMLKGWRVVEALLAILVVWGGCHASVAFAQDCPELDGQWPDGGPARHAELSGDLLYLGVGETLKIFDISDPENPMILGGVGFHYSVEGMALSDGYAYVYSGVGEDGVYTIQGLLVIDVSTPTSPKIVGSCPFPQHWRDIGSIVVSGDYVFFDFDGVMRWVDISMPSAPVPGEYGWAVPGEVFAISGGHFFMAGDDGSFSIVDFSPIQGPQIIGSVNMPGSLSNVALSGDYAYVTGSSGLGVIDVSTPSSPVEVGHVEDLGDVSALAVTDDHAFVVVRESDSFGLAVIDISRPTAPFEVGRLEALWAEEDPDRQGRRVAVSGSHVYVAAEGEGLRVIDVSTPESPAEVGFYNPSTLDGGALTISGGYAYLAAENGGGFHVFDAGSPDTLIEVGSCALPVESSINVAVSSGYAYVAAFHDGLRVIDIRSPSSPVEVGFTEILNAFDVAVSGDYLFVTDFGEGLRVYNVSTPASPAEVAFHPIPNVVLGVAVSCGYAYVASRDRPGLRIIDVSSPTSPTEVRFFGIPQQQDVYDVAVSGKLAYVSGWQGLWIVDITEPDSPRKVSSLDLNNGDGLYHVEVHGGLAFLASRHELVTIDINRPGSPVEVCRDNRGFFDINDLDIAGGYVYLTGQRLFDRPGSTVEIFRSNAAECTPIHIAAAASGAGLGGSLWATDLGINNRGDKPLNCSFQFLPRGEDNTDVAFSEEVTVAPDTNVNFVDIWRSSTGNNGAGSINVCVSDPDDAGVVSRTYNTSDEGTFGQSIVGLKGSASGTMITSGESVRLGFLTENSAFHTNIGFMNVTACDITVNVEFFTDAGASLGIWGINLPPYSNNQSTQAFRRVTDDAVDLGYADVWSDTMGAEFLTYASVIDNGTGDPTTIWPFDTSTTAVGGGSFDCSPVWVAAAASAPGADGTQWATDLGINNLSSDTLTYRLQFLPRDQDNSGAGFSAPLDLGGHQAVAFRDVWKNMTGTSGAGAINVCLDAEDSGHAGIISRTYNTGDQGTFGQAIVGMSGATPAKIVTGEKARLAYLFENDAYRTNIGFMNAGGTEITVAAEFFDMQGNSLGTKSATLAPYSNTQWNNAYTLYPINADDITAGFVDVWTATADAALLTYASIVDNETGDPTTIWPF